MMKKIPSHFTGEIQPVKETVTIHGKYKPYMLDSSFSHIRCCCGTNLFRIYLSDYPEVMCACTSCGQEYVVYDSSFYPAGAGFEPDRGGFTKWVSGSGKDVFQVIAIWLYSPYPDHRDDVDWFVMITVDPETREYEEIINYQT